MTSHLEKEIAELKEMLLTMAGHAEAAVSGAVRALVERNDQLAQTVIDSDAVVDRLEVEIDERVILLLSKAMLATDLRLMTVGMKLSHDLERVADEATTIARRAILLNAEPASGLAADVPRMAGLALAMLHEALDSFVNQQPEKARALGTAGRNAVKEKFSASVMARETIQAYEEVLGRSQPIAVPLQSA
jgi:phosphate transport system protein